MLSDDDWKPQGPSISLQSRVRRTNAVPVSKSGRKNSKSASRSSSISERKKILNNKLGNVELVRKQASEWLKNAESLRQQSEQEERLTMDSIQDLANEILDLTTDDEQSEEEDYSM
eukprot:UN26319